MRAIASGTARIVRGGQITGAIALMGHEKGVVMVKGLAQILGFQLLGEILVRWWVLPVSGAVLGMVLLLSFLLATHGPGEDLKKAGEGLLRHLALLFVPAGAGLILYLDVLRKEWMAIALALVAGTMISLGATALLMQWLMRRQERKKPLP